MANANDSTGAPGRIRPALSVTIVAVLTLNGCSSRSPSNQQSTPPVITSEAVVVAVEDVPFVYVAKFEDPDGPDTLVTFYNYPGWMTVEADSISGLPVDGTTDTTILLVVSDGIYADSLEISVVFSPVNDPPAIESLPQVEAAADIDFQYVVTVQDPDGPSSTIEFMDYPSWLSPADRFLTGTPPPGASDTNFTAIASDRFLADTLQVRLIVNPTLVVYGDTRTGHTVHQQVVDQIRAVKPSAVFHVGDLVNNGLNRGDWDTFDLITADMRAESEFYPALGNHEYQSPLYFDRFDLPGNEQWYLVAASHIRFFILNTCVDISPGSEQYEWLEAELGSIPDSIRFSAIVFHHPAYTTGAHAEDEKGLREYVVPLLESSGVDIVFAGHDHDYERSYCGGIYHIVTGGGGAPLRDQARSHPCSELFIKQYHFCRLSVVDSSLRVRVYNESSVLIDDITLGL